MGPGAHDPNQLVGSEIGGYRLERMLGEGAASVVYFGKRTDSTPKLVERYGDLPSLVSAPDQWVWAIAVSSSLLDSPPCGGPGTPQPCPSPDATTMFILNYNTGAYLGDWSPAFP